MWFGHLGGRDSELIHEDRISWFSLSLEALPGSDFFLFTADEVE